MFLVFPSFKFYQVKDATLEKERIQELEQGSVGIEEFDSNASK
jgi:hypothetical protein